MSNEKQELYNEIKKCKLIVFSDIHYLDKRPNNIDWVLSRKLTQYADELLDNLIKKINNEYRPDLCICLGDLIEDQFNYEQDLNNYKYIWNKLKNINTPFYSAIGNHDLRTIDSRKTLEEIMNYENATFSFDLNGYHFVILSTDIIKDIKIDESLIKKYKNVTEKELNALYKSQCISEKEINWLKEDLQKNNFPCLIFTHYGLAEDEQIGNYWFEIEPEVGLLGNRKVVKDIIKNDENVIAIFTAHQHWTKRITEDGKDYYILGSLTENINNDGIPDGVYFEVDLDGCNVKVIEKHIQI